jgi:hypothetical protein
MGSVCAGETKLVGDRAEVLVCAIGGGDADLILSSLLEEVAKECSSEP